MQFRIAALITHSLAAVKIFSACVCVCVCVSVCACCDRWNEFTIWIRSRGSTMKRGNRSTTRQQPPQNRWSLAFRDWMYAPNFCFPVEWIIKKRAPSVARPNLPKVRAAYARRTKDGSLLPDWVSIRWLHALWRRWAGKGTRLVALSVRHSDKSRVRGYSTAPPAHPSAHR